VAEKANNVAGSLDHNPQWHTLNKLTATATQSKNALFARTAVGTYMIKSGTSMLQEIFAGELCTCLGIRAPRTRILTILDMEMVWLQSAFTTYASSTSAAVSRPDGKVLLLMEYIPGVRMLIGSNPPPADTVLNPASTSPDAHVKCGDSQSSAVELPYDNNFLGIDKLPYDNSLEAPIQETIFTAAKAAGASDSLGQRNLRRLGEIVAFDMLINNTDRVPAVWDNEGNLGNLLFDEAGAIVAIDQQLIAITTAVNTATAGAAEAAEAVEENPLLEKYLERVSTLLSQVCGTEWISLASVALAPVRECIQKEAGYDILEAGCVLIAEGMRQCAATICQLTPDHLNTIHERVTGVLPAPLLQQAIESSTLQALDLVFVERVLTIFRDHQPPATSATASIRWPLAQPSAPAIDEQAAKDAAIQMIELRMNGLASPYWKKHALDKLAECERKQGAAARAALAAA
jgi:hypothetical protein